MEPANFSICNYEFLTNLQTAIFPTPTVKSSSSLCKSLCGQFNKVVRATSVRKLHSIFASAEIHTKRPPLPLPLTFSHFLTKKHSRTIPGKSIIFIIKRIKNFVRKTFPHFSHETTSRFFSVLLVRSFEQTRSRFADFHPIFPLFGRDSSWLWWW